MDGETMAMVAVAGSSSAASSSLAEDALKLLRALGAASWPEPNKVARRDLRFDPVVDVMPTARRRVRDLAERLKIMVLEKKRKVGSEDDFDVWVCRSGLLTF